MNWFWGKTVQRWRKVVLQDWARSLSKEKDLLFGHRVADLEQHYGMLSVVLNEAYRLKEMGQLVQAREAAVSSAQLAKRLGEKLDGSLKTLAGHAKHFGTMTTVTPLNGGFFRTAGAQRKATWTKMVGAVMSSRTMFFVKVRALQEVVEALMKEYGRASAEIGEGTTVEPEQEWGHLELLHYELNTCMRETIVVLKSFLVVLPEGEVDSFSAALANLETQKAPNAKAAITRAWT